MEVQQLHLDDRIGSTSPTSSGIDSYSKRFGSRSISAPPPRRWPLRGRRPRGLVEVGGAQLTGLLLHRRVEQGGEHHDLVRGLGRAERPDGAQALGAGEDQVEDHHVGAVLLGQDERGGRAGGVAHDVVPVVDEHRQQETAEAVVVVGEHDGGHERRAYRCPSARPRREAPVASPR